jgi:predicted Fe-Mo cluster-binding NifX family protein
MKIAITSTGNSLESELDPRFGRCAYFIIYDTGTREHDIIRNENKNIDDGAGPKAVELIASHQVKKVISKEFGIKIKSLLCDYKIQMIMIKEKRTIEEIIKLINH